MKIVILCNGDFPTAPQPLKALDEADRIICCDGAYDTLMRHNHDIRTPLIVIGDLDSIAARENVEAIRIDEQDTNDQTKAFRYVRSKWPDASISILGATGKREDHTLGNISLLADYLESFQSSSHPSLRLLTDYGVFTPINAETTFPSFPRQQVSLFSMTPGCLISTEGLQYPLQRQPLSRLWQGTLNAALSHNFTINPTGGLLIVYQTYEPKQ
jgi:thiamine pyrophosphokinase